MTDKVQVYGEAYRVKLENEMLKYENNYLKSLIDLSSMNNNLVKTNAYKDLIKIMQTLRKPPISYFCRHNTTFRLYEKRYFDEAGNEQFDELLNHRAESDLIALLNRINSTPFAKLLKLSSKYKKLVNEYL